MKCKLVDVFAKEKLSGNGLTIFYDYDSLDKSQMLSLTQEMRQFESIFVQEHECEFSVRAKIFTIEEELDFAGHPIIGLAAHLHEESGDLKPREWKIELNKKTVIVRTKKTDNESNNYNIYIGNNGISKVKLYIDDEIDIHNI